MWNGWGGAMEGRLLLGFWKLDTEGCGVGLIRDWWILTHGGVSGTISTWIWYGSTWKGFVVGRVCTWEWILGREWIGFGSVRG